jgi:hypothetical protein
MPSPEVADLLARFTDPAPQYGPLPIWWWSGAPVTRERLRWQLEKLVAGGIRQAVVLCLAPTGPMFGSVADDPPFLSPAWLELFDQACADAEELGFTLWMYDQIGFSGANFQGRLIAENPDFAGRTLGRLESEGTNVQLVAPPGHEALTAYAILPSGERVEVSIVDGLARYTGACRLVLVYARTSGFDYFSEAACATLLDQVHGTLERAVGHWFGRSIGGFFQDELPPMPSWGRDFAPTFQARYGYDLVPALWALWEHDSSVEAMSIRRDYQEHRATLARRGFFDQHDAWFADRGLICGFDQASPAREGDPLGGVQIYGDYLQLHRGYGAPGSDHWGDAKVHSSLAHANGHERVWIEAFHSSGWGGTLEETYDWLSPFLRRGANLYDPHAVYYSTVGGWWEWAPPSTCWRQPYWPSYHVFSGAVSRLCSVLTAGRHVCDVVLLSPTANAQSHLTLSSPLPDRSAETFRQLNGINSWFNQHRGVLERAGIDHDVLDETTIASASVESARIVVADEAYGTVLVPAAEVLHGNAARRLLDLAATGGRVICVGEAPKFFLGGEDVAEDFAAAVRTGQVQVVADPNDVPTALQPAMVRANAPFLHRQHGTAHVLAFIAHDENSGTVDPILQLDGASWMESEFSWQEYNRQLRTDGYRFVNVGDRVVRAQIDGVARPRAQSWSPGTGNRTELTVTETDGGWSFEAPFDDGAVVLVILAADLPEPTATSPGPITETIEVPGPWLATAESTVDNQWGDLAAVARTGIIPVQGWRMDHVVCADTPTDEAEWQPVIATFGPFAEVDGQNAEWSLSRGIYKDPAHAETLGPKGYVPEHFLDWREVKAGERVSVRTHLPLPETSGLLLAIGASATRRLWIDGVSVPISGEGHQSFSRLPADGRTASLDIELTADRDGPLRAYFAVVTDDETFRRPEWIRPETTGASTDLTIAAALVKLPADATVYVSSDGACSLLVNGTEAGRQGDFNPYPDHREVRVHPYDIGGLLRIGDNAITLRITGETAAAFDSVGLGIRSGAHWSATTDGMAAKVVEERRHEPDPHVICQSVRPHSLPGASWLEPAAASDGVVLPVIPDIAPGPARTEWLRLRVPPGTISLRVPTDLDFSTFVNDREALIRVTAIDGRRGGALLDGPIEFELAEAEFPLLSWDELGLRGLAGQVTYRTNVTLERLGGRITLDLGEVRGTADVLVNGQLASQLVWGPWRTDITDLVTSGQNEIVVVVRGTLAGYLDDVSPTLGVYAGQVRTGLFGPVTVKRADL